MTVTPDATPAAPDRRRVRVLFVIPGMNASAGAEQSFAALAPCWADLGVEMHLVVLTERQALLGAVERDGVVVHDRSAARGTLGAARAVVEVVRNVGPDVVHATLWDAAVPSHLASLRTRLPLVVTWASVGNAAQHTGPVGAKVRAVRTLEAALARNPRVHFHAVTAGVGEANRRALGVPASKVSVVERGRPDLAGTVDDAAAARVRAELGIAPEERIVLAVGRHEPVKDHVTLVRAVAIARAAVGPDRPVRLLVAGRTGSATADLETAIRDSGAAAAVQLLGQRDDVPTLLAAADVFAMSSRSEGAAGALIEALMMGVPVVSTDVEGQRGILVDGANARVVPVGDAEAFGAALTSVLAGDGEDERLARAGRRTYEDRFTLARSAEGMAALYRTQRAG